MRPLLRFTTALAVIVGMTTPATAAVLYDQDVTPGILFGSGNANGGFTVDKSNGVELGLRAKLRFDDSNQPQNIFNSNGDGTYSFVAGLPPTGFGFAPGSTSTAVWNFEWSINTDVDGTSGQVLSDLTYQLQIDFDPSAGTNFLTFDPINLAAGDYADHAVGNNSTGNGAGVSATDAATYQTLIDQNNVAQNSWNMEFFDNPGLGYSFDGRVQGIYDFVLTAFAPGVGQVAQTSIRVYSTPEPSSLALLSLGVAGLAGVRHRRHRRNTAAEDSTDGPADA